LDRRSGKYHSELRDEGEIKKAACKKQLFLERVWKLFHQGYVAHLIVSIAIHILVLDPVDINF
jgi:hypothetical protein